MAFIIFERWLTMDDRRVCAQCAAMAGQVMMKGVGPQPPLHPNCRCRRVQASAVHTPEIVPGPESEKDDPLN